MHPVPAAGTCPDMSADKSRHNFGRAHPNHRERGRKRYVYTCEDIAKEVGLKVESIYKARARGELDPADLGSVARFISRRQDPQPHLKVEVYDSGLEALDRAMAPKPPTDCSCPLPRSDGYVASQRAFYCTSCGLVTRRI